MEIAPQHTTTEHLLDFCDRLTFEGESVVFPAFQQKEFVLIISTSRYLFISARTRLGERAEPFSDHKRAFPRHLVDPLLQDVALRAFEVLVVVKEPINLSTFCQIFFPLFELYNLE